MRSLWATVLTFGLCACATLPRVPPRGPPSRALPAMASGPLADLEQAALGGAQPTDSSFHLIDSNIEGLRWRLALVDSARGSLDMQYYFWWGDDSGQLLMRHVIAAADRGVKVRLILDDLSTLLAGERQLQVRDREQAKIDAHPNIEVRLFNPFHARSMPGRAFEYLRHARKMNRRMHNKLFIADNRVAILGGRNVGNEYFGLSREFDFIDLDVLGVGPVARQTSGEFDEFWNSSWVVPVAALHEQASARDLKASKRVMRAQLRDSTVLASLPLDRADWHGELDELKSHLERGSSIVVTDVPAKDGVRHHMPETIHRLLQNARSEVLIANAYFIPQAEDVALLHELAARGVKVRILTNSLASQDVVAVNSHYKRWRKRLLAAGVELYEVRPDAAIAPILAEAPQAWAPRVGLHAKSLVVDRERVFVGSMNLDPRSAAVNSEMGIIVHSPSLGRELAVVIEREMQGRNAWAVIAGADGRVVWKSDSQLLTHQPALGPWQRVEDVFFMPFPQSLY